MRSFFLLGLISMVDAAKMICGSNVTICGVLTLETGLGTGVYHHGFASVHGLWPETGRYGTSDCVRPTKSSAPASKVYSCYSRANGGDTTSILGFENHEWTKHGQCAGVQDVDDFFAQVCQLSSEPLSLMKGKTSLQAAQAALENAGFEIFNADQHNAQLSLSACFHQDSGKWLLAAVADFPRKCGSKGVHRVVPPSDSNGSSHSHSHGSSGAADVCLPNQHGPPCGADLDCMSHDNCLRCAHSGFCTAIPLTHVVDVNGRFLRGTKQ